MSEVKGIFATDMSLNNLRLVLNDAVTLIDNYFKERIGMETESFCEYVKKSDLNLLDRLESYLPTINYRTEEINRLIKEHKQLKKIVEKKSNVIRGPW